MESEEALLAFQFRHRLAQPPHAANPPSSVGRAVRVVLRHFRMRKDQKNFLGQRFHDAIGDEFRRDRIRH